MQQTSGIKYQRSTFENNNNNIVKSWQLINIKSLLAITSSVVPLDKLEENIMRSNVVIATSKQSTVAKNKFFFTKLKVAERLITYII